MNNAGRGIDWARDSNFFKSVSETDFLSFACVKKFIGPQGQKPEFKETLEKYPLFSKQTLSNLPRG